MKDKIEIIMVAYNEADCIEEVLRSFYKVASNYAKVQIIVAEDGSTDGTRDILKRLASELPIKLALDDKRRGYAGAVKDAIMVAECDTIMFVDSDGQYLPEDIPAFYETWNNNIDMLIGVKKARQDPIHRKLISWVFHSIVCFFFKVPFKDMDTGYRFIKKGLAQKIAPQCHLLHYSYWSEFTIRSLEINSTISTVPINHRDRLSGVSRMYPILKLPSMTIEQLRGLWILHRELHSNR